MIQCSHSREITMLRIKSKITVGLALAALFVSTAYAQTIDSLILSQRAKLVDESNKKNNPLAVISNQGSAPIQLQAQPSLPSLGPLPDLPGLSTASGLPPKPVEKPVFKVVFDIANTKYIAVYGVAGKVVAEITYNGYLAKVEENSELIDGWFVKSIDAKKVILTKSDPKLGNKTHVLLFNIGDAVIKTTQVQKKVPPKKKLAQRLTPPTVEQLSNTAPASADASAALSSQPPATAMKQ